MSVPIVTRFWLYLIGLAPNGRNSTGISNRVSVVMLCCLCTLGGLPALPSMAQNALATLDKPFLFAYGSWEKRARIEKGVALLNAEGMTPRGGAGVNQLIDLRGHADESPGLRVQVGPHNTLKTLRLMLTDTQGRTGTWNFVISGATGTSKVLVPVDGAPLSHPNETGKSGALDLARIMQWQLMGDWGGDGPIDIRTEGLLLLPADAAIRQAREALQKKDEEARLAAERERLAARARYAKRTADSPEIRAVYAASPDILGIQIFGGKITTAHLAEYLPLQGDTRNDNNGKDRPHLIRNGKDLGMLVGPPGKESGLVTFEGFTGDPLLLAEADDPANFSIRSQDDPDFKVAIVPRKVSRKSKPDDWQQPIQQGVVVRHTLYLPLPHRLKPGKTYTIGLGNLNVRNVRQEQIKFKFEPDRVWTEAIHVDQVGFRPDDPLKRAYLSLWMGNGGGYAFPANQPFYLLDAMTGKRVYTGTIGTAWPADKSEKMHVTRNFNGTAVSPIDFSDFKSPGQYRVEVEGLGVSYPFEIGSRVWEKAFWVQMKGFYNERSGVALGPPYTDFVRPVCFKPGVNGCMPITQSSYNILDDQPGGLPKYDTGKPVPEAWGGYHDAGDWNPRRMDHMTSSTFWQLELLQLFPTYFSGLKLNIPNDAPGPDLLKECLFELSLFHRLQLPDGSCRYGIETDGDPSGGEVSWKQHMPAFVYGPDAYSSYLFAAVAARASQVLEAYDKPLAKTYRQDAIRAMRWAEADRLKRKANGSWDKLVKWNLPGERNRAAICLYAATHDIHWHEVFLEDTPLKSSEPLRFLGNNKGRDAAFTYVRLPEGMGDPVIRKHAREALLSDADGSLEYQQNNAFGIASDDPGKPQFLGFYSTPHGAVSMLRAYHLTHAPKYRRGALQACLFAMGANPDNLVYTSGLGTHPIHPLNLDALATGQKPPIGLTPYGIVDFAHWSDNWIVWPLNYFLGKHTQPTAFDWPTTESFFDVRFMPALNEFTIDQTMGPNAYVWGYLAAVP